MNSLSCHVVPKLKIPILLPLIHTDLYQSGLQADAKDFNKCIVTSSNFNG